MSPNSCNALIVVTSVKLSKDHNDYADELFVFKGITRKFICHRFDETVAMPAFDI